MSASVGHWSGHWLAYGGRNCGGDADWQGAAVSCGFEDAAGGVADGDVRGEVGRGGEEVGPHDVSGRGPVVWLPFDRSAEYATSRARSRTHSSLTRVNRSTSPAAWHGWRARNRAAAMVAGSRTRRSVALVVHSSAVTHRRVVSPLTWSSGFSSAHRMSLSTAPPVSWVRYSHPGRNESRPPMFHRMRYSWRKSAFSGWLGRAASRNSMVSAGSNVALRRSASVMMSPVFPVMDDAARQPTPAMTAAAMASSSPISVENSVNSRPRRSARRRRPLRGCRRR